MTRRKELLPAKTTRRYLGSSYDLKPTLGEQDTGAEFWERDTKDKYEWFGEDWVRTVTSGIASVQEHEQHLTAELHDAMEEIVKQLKILNTYMSLAHGEKLTIGDIEEE